MPRNCAKDIIDEIEYLLPQELQKHKQIRHKFTDEEDNLIINLVGDNQFPNWNEIAKSIPNKSGRQCRERYQNYLSPDLSKNPWTQEEDELIISLYKEFGSSWSLIADHFGGKRTNNNIKNRWNSHLKSKFNELSQNQNLKAIKNSEDGNIKIDEQKSSNIYTNEKLFPFSQNSCSITNSANTSKYSLHSTPLTKSYTNNSNFNNSTFNHLLGTFHQKRNQNILQKLVLMNQEPIIRREVQQKVIRQRQQKRIQNQQDEIQNEDYFANCFDDLVDSAPFNQDSLNTFNSIFNESSDLEIFGDSF